TREVEAHSDPPSPLFAFGKGSLLQIRLRRLLIMESGGFRSSTLPLRNPVYFGLSDSKSVEISMFDGTRRREDSAVKNGYGFVGGLSVSQLRRTRVLMVLLRRRRGGGG
ncbi:unnamed protein product, partial [Brassica rapa subsp. narinosa]